MPSDELANALAAKAAAEKEAAHWRRIVESLPEYVSLFDREGRFLYNNRVEGDYQGEEYIGRSLGEIVPEHYWRTAFDQTLASGQRTEYESHDPQRNHWFRCSVGRVELDDGQMQLAVVSHNVDDEKRTQRELADAQELWNSLVANSPDMILLAEPDSRVLFISKIMPGYTRDDVIGRLGTEFIEPQHRAAMLDAIRDASQARQPRIVEMQDTRARMWWRVTMVPVRDSRRGDLVLVICQDVTGRRQQELALRAAHDELEQRVAERTAALQASEARFRGIADTLPVAIVITRVLDGEVVYVNQRTCELLGESAAALVGRKSTEFYADPAEREALLARLRESATVLDLELWLHAAGGRRMLVSGNYQPLRFDGEACILTGFVDLTKRYDAEQALLDERRLLKRLLDLNERDRQLISYEIHDGIVQDMTAAQMFFESSRPELPEGHSTNEAYANALRVLRGGIDEARRLVNGLRPPALEDHGVASAIEALVDEVEQSAGIDIELKIDVKFQRLAPTLEMAIYRSVQEGLNNVWHHSRSPRARVELVQREHNIEIRIQDWGVGFDPANVSRRRYGLTGMRERARLLQGRAIIHSAIGQGTTLQIELPLIDALLPDE